MLMRFVLEFENVAVMRQNSVSVLFARLAVPVKLASSTASLNLLIDGVF